MSDINDMIMEDMKTWNVLVVDDKADNLKLITLILQHQGCRITACEKSTEVFEYIAQVKPNLILLDLAMPILNGWEIHKRLRANQPDLNFVPIIAVTALAMPNDSKKAKEAGFDGYITKPYQVDQLNEQLKKCVHEFILKHT